MASIDERLSCSTERDISSRDVMLINIAAKGHFIVRFFVEWSKSRSNEARCRDGTMDKAINEKLII